MDIKELLQKLSDSFGVAGYEDETRDIIISIIAPLVDEVEVDTLGNLIAHKKGKSDTLLMLDAHMDEIGLMVNFIDDNGFLRFAKLGGWDDRILMSQRVTIQTRSRKRVIGIIGNLPPHLQTEEEFKRVVRSDDLFIDIGATNAEEVSEMGIRVGDIVVIYHPFTQMTENYFTGKAFDNRAGCAVIIKCLEALKKQKSEISVAAVFSVAEEKGMIGAMTAAFGLEPDIALVLEGTIGADIPGVELRKQPVVLGKGPAISIADKLICIKREMWEFIEGLAQTEKIPYQFKMPTYSGTNAGAIHSSRTGVLTGVVSVPCRYIHSPVSTMRLDDFENTVSLVTLFVKNSHRLLK
jgi:tetrahedral aminopeptidase